MIPKIGQRWKYYKVWDKDPPDIIVVEIIDLNAGYVGECEVRTIILYCSFASGAIGLKCNYVIPGDFWEYLKGQDKP